MIPTPQRIEFLSKLHLFRGLNEADLTAIADEMEEQICAPDEEIFRQGAEGDRFFIIYSGKVRVLRWEGSQNREIARLVDYDYFGESSLLNHTRRSATIHALEETLLLTLTRQDFQELIGKVPALRVKFEVSIASHRLERRARFSWLEDGEVIYFLARRHTVELWRALAGPILGFILPGVLLILVALTDSIVPLVLAGVTFLALAGWTGWRLLDWSNDYYIVTNRRVIWLEKVIGLYDSRQEAPLTAVLSVNSETDVTGRLLGYGNVIIRTFVGNITFASVGYPAEVEALVREHWERTKEVSRRANIEALKDAIRQKLGLAAPAPKAAPTAASQKPAQPPGLARILLANLFKLRFEQGGTITYRKHSFVLIKQTWVPGLLFLFLLVWLIYNLFSGPFEFGSLETILLFFMAVAAGWWIYQYIDWSNDIFQVTADQIMDLDRTPLGKSQKNVAPLDNILNMEARREGLLQMVFNYGNVYITVGGAQMVFEDVINPTAVQQDIDRRRVARKQKQDQDRIAADRDRLAEFFAMYHNHAGEFSREIEEHRPEPPGADGRPPETEVQ